MHQHGFSPSSGPFIPGRLPSHTYFITLRLADSIPPTTLEQLQQEKLSWLDENPPPPWSPETELEYHRRFTGTCERWLDQGYGSCLFANMHHALIARDALQLYEGLHSHLHSWVIMPNHLHAIVSLIGNPSLSKMVDSWKEYSSRQIEQATGTPNPIWQHGFYDRVIRSWSQFAGCARYIRNNPQRSKLVERGYLFHETQEVSALLRA